MWVALLLGLVSGSLASGVAHWLPARVADEEATPPSDMGAAEGGAGPRPLWRSAMLILGSAALAVYLNLTYSWSPVFWARFTLCEVLLLIAAIDLEHRLVPNVLVGTGLALSLLFSAVWLQPPLRSALLGAAVAGVSFLVIAALGRGALGPGDVKLAVLIGAICGFPAVVQALVTGILLGGLAAGILMATRVRGPKQFIPYAPYLVAGCLSTMLFGQQIARWWERLPGLGG